MSQLVWLTSNLEVLLGHFGAFKLGVFDFVPFWGNDGVAKEAMAVSWRLEHGMKAFWLIPRQRYVDPTTNCMLLNFCTAWFPLLWRLVSFTIFLS
ncbi:hypothetical protein ACFX2I_004759 [Malus domestica]